MEINIRQIKIKNRPDYLFNVNKIDNIKDFDSNLLKMYRFLFKGVLVVIFTASNTSPQNVLIMLMMIKITSICFLMMQMDTLMKIMELSI